MPGTFSPPPQVSNPDMHHDTWLRTMCGSLWASSMFMKIIVNHLLALAKPNYVNQNRYHLVKMWISAPSGWWERDESTNEIRSVGICAIVEILRTKQSYQNFADYIFLFFVPSPISALSCVNCRMYCKICLFGWFLFCCGYIIGCCGSTSSIYSYPSGSVHGHSLWFPQHKRSNLGGCG